MLAFVGVMGTEALACTPINEIFDGIDNDCDGSIDEGVFEPDPPVVFEGFSSPVGPDNELGGTRAGRAVPLTFALFEDGVAVTSTSEVEVVTVPLGDRCETPSAGAESVGAEDAGRSRLRYDTDEGQFVFAWKTERDWAGTCRAVEVLYGDEVVGSATVSFAG